LDKCLTVKAEPSTDAAAVAGPSTSTATVAGPSTSTSNVVNDFETERLQAAMELSRLQYEHEKIKKEINDSLDAQDRINVTNDTLKNLEDLINTKNEEIAKMRTDVENLNKKKNDLIKDIADLQSKLDKNMQLNKSIQDKKIITISIDDTDDDDDDTDGENGNKNESIFNNVKSKVLNGGDEDGINVANTTVLKDPEIVQMQIDVRKKISEKKASMCFIDRRKVYGCYCISYKHQSDCYKRNDSVEMAWLKKRKATPSSLYNTLQTFKKRKF
jgi:chromosome segregation ATPase